VLNVALLSVTSLFGLYVLMPALQKEVSFIPPPAKKQDDTAEQKDEPPPASSPLEFAMIADQNLFHPERRIPPEKKDAPPPLPKPEIVLHGTLVTEEVSVAYIDDIKAPYTTPGRGKRLRAMKKGESLSGFVLKEIGEDKILLVRGEEHMVVTLNDPSKPKAREGVTTATPTPAGTQPSGIATPQPTTAPATRASGAATSRSQPPPATPAGQATVTTPAAAAPAQPAQPAPQPGTGDARRNFLDLLRRGGR
jgi:hypothetical protein